MKNRRGRERGFSMVEILVALLILVSLVLGLGKSALAARRTGSTGLERAAATTLARDRIEFLRLLPASASELSAGAHADSPSPMKADGSAGGFFTRTWTVTDGAPMDGMKRIDMRVSWPAAHGQRAVTLVTYVLS